MVYTVILFFESAFLLFRALPGATGQRRLAHSKGKGGGDINNEGRVVVELSPKQRFAPTLSERIYRKRGRGAQRSFRVPGTKEGVVL